MPYYIAMNEHQTSHLDVYYYLARHANELDANLRRLADLWSVNCGF